MNKTNRNKIAAKIFSIAEDAQEKLPDWKKYFPEGRSATAFFYGGIKRVFGCPIEEVPDNCFNICMSIIDILQANVTNKFAYQVLDSRLKTLG